MNTPTDDELIEIHRQAIEEAMRIANERDGFASSGSRESIVAGLRAVVEYPRTGSQGRPTDAQVEAALQAYWEDPEWEDWSAAQDRKMRAALRAAGGIG